ncbi:Arsb [Symbiodinium pilosum]|uniref:Arsb protein n=1 Tax=Symbiodinium pilosum TaxID=2952 RepID=A0A812X9K4_SYMPI|nr:Arsb [Symbiodinium pilosum]
MAFLLALLALLATGTLSWAEAKPPNILFILADDLGFNDVSFHGSPQIPTPNIDEIARTGITLNSYYAQPVCSPTRATIMSGRHVSHTGIYMPLMMGTAARLNISYSTLPQFLEKLGYDTHMVGKWHLGQNELAAMPTGRGFASFFGYLSGEEDYITHQAAGAFDLFDGTRTAFEFNGTHSTGLWVSKVLNLLSKPSEKPFFIYLAFQNVHWPLEPTEEALRRFEGKTGGDAQRQGVCGLASMLDDAVGQVIRKLKDQRLYDDTLIVFASDNGGPTNGFQGTWSSNYPMRGGKNTLWEGGTRVAAAIRGPGIPQELVGSVSYHKVHAADWLPTLVRVAANDPKWLERNWPQGEPVFELGDGMDVWDTFSKGVAVREEVLLEAHQQDETRIAHGNSLIVGDWKILKLSPSQQEEFGWVPPPGQNPREVEYQLPCRLADQPRSVDYTECSEEFCLFNVASDPCEYRNVAKEHPKIVARLAERLAEYQKTAVPAVNSKDCGCAPVMVKGAWRPCDLPDPGAAWALRNLVV